MLKLITYLSIFTFYFLLFTFPVSAETSASNNYQIQMGNLNMAAGSPQSATKRIGLTGGQTAPGPYASAGYKVKGGFWYIFPRTAFSFTISDLTIDFGNLVAGTPSTQTNNLTVTATSIHGYQVTASASAQLTNTAGTATIPKTSCNGGADTCTELQAKTWTDNSKYGFGYNVSGTDATGDFLSGNYYRPFSATSAAVIMSRAQPSKSRTATVTYKVDVAASQAAGDYQNYIMFVATPTY